MPLDRKAFLDGEAEFLLCCENPLRWVMFPIEFPAIHDLYKRLEGVFWTPASFLLGNRISALPQSLLRVQAALCGSPALVKRADARLQDELLFSCALSQKLQVPEARAFLGFQNMNEVIFKRAISALTRGETPDSAFDVLSAATQQCVRDVHEFFLAHVTNLLERELSLPPESAAAQVDAPLAELLVAFGIRKALFAAPIFFVKYLCQTSQIHSTCAEIAKKMTASNLIYIEFYSHIYQNLPAKLEAAQLEDLVAEAVALTRQLLQSVLAEGYRPYVDCLLGSTALHLLKSFSGSESYAVRSNAELLKLQTFCNEHPDIQVHKFRLTPSDKEFYKPVVVDGALLSTSDGADAAAATKQADTFKFDEDF